MADKRLGENKYKKFIFGTTFKHRDIVSKSLEYAVKIFKLEELWPEKYVAKKYLIGNEYENEAGEHVYKTKKEAKINVYIDDENEKKHWSTTKVVLELDLMECLNYDYNFDEKDETMLLTDGNEEEQEDKEAIEIYKEIKKTVTNKMVARQKMIDIHKMTMELEKQKDLLDEQIAQFEKIIEVKKKQLFAIETYLGLNEEIVVLSTGVKAKEEEKIAIFQQKCYMDEEYGLTEIEGRYRYEQGLDFEDIEKFDKWISLNYKKYIYKEKGIMAWEIRRSDKEYSTDFYHNKIMNLNNRMTYFLIRNGENLYRIYSGVYTTDRVFPSVKDIEEVLAGKGYYGDLQKEVAEKKYREFVEKRVYIYIALQGIIDRTDIFGHAIKGKVNLVYYNKSNDDYIELIRDAEYEYYLNDGKKLWKDYLRDNQKTITVGSRILINNQNRWDYDNWYYDKKKRANKEYNGNVYIAEMEKSQNNRDSVKKIYPYYDRIIEVLSGYDKIKYKKNWEKKINEVFNEKGIDVYFKESIFCESTRNSKFDEIKAVLLIIKGTDNGLNDPYYSDNKRILFKDTLKDGYVDIKFVIKWLNINRSHWEERCNARDGSDMFKIYEVKKETIYKGWSDYEGHERKNRVGYWYEREKLLNVDEIELEDIDYYLNNRLYRKDYLKMFTFLKYARMFKLNEHEKEKDFIKLVMDKSGCKNENIVRDCMKWWKIKNKWRRFLTTDEDKAYRMIMSKVKKENI